VENGLEHKRRTAFLTFGLAALHSSSKHGHPAVYNGRKRNSNRFICVTAGQHSVPRK